MGKVLLPEPAPACGVPFCFVFGVLSMPFGPLAGSCADGTMAGGGV
jgi:hypothetical protein